MEEDRHGYVEFGELHDAFQSEIVENGYTVNISKRLLTDHLRKLFPGVKTRTENTGSTVTIYLGIRFLSTHPCFEKPETLHPQIKRTINLQFIKELLPSHVQVTEESCEELKCFVETDCSINGHQVVKKITFHNSGKWELKIGDKIIDLEKVYVASTFLPNKRGIDTVITAVDKMVLCEGIAVTQNVVMSRFHVLEMYKSTNAQSRRLKTMLCHQVTPITSETHTCEKCRKMTIQSGSIQGPHSSSADHSNSTSSTDQTSTCDSKKVTTKDEILKMFPGATEEMLEMLLNQSQNSIRDPKGRRWTPGLLSVCLKWYCRSPQSYEAFRDTKFLILPSKSTLVQYKARIRQRVGFDDDIFLWMFEEARRKNIPVEGYNGGLIIDEMSIQSDIQICKNGDLIELTGFVDVGDEGNSNLILRKGKNERTIGTHALQFVFLGLSGFRFPIAHFVSDGIQPSELDPLFWEGVDKLRMFGFNVLYTCMDGAQSNRTFMHINVGVDSKTFSTPSPCSFDHMIFMMDCKHVTKKIRNNILKSGITQNSTRLLSLPGSDETIQWQMFVDCYKWDKTNALQIHRKLTNEHMYPSNQLKMRNHLAEDVLDSEMLNLMIEYQKHLGDKASILNGVVELLKRTSSFIQFFNDKRPVKTLNDERLKELVMVANWFDEWKKKALQNEEVTKKNRGKSILSLQCHEDIQACILGFPVSTFSEVV